jgi:hypothetical protein
MISYWLEAFANLASEYINNNNYNYIYSMHTLHILQILSGSVVAVVAWQAQLKYMRLGTVTSNFGSNWVLRASFARGSLDLLWFGPL